MATLAIDPFPVPVVPRRPKLGALLARLGLVSRSDLERALERQVAEGGRLGTCLLDLGLIDEDSLLAALGALHGTGTVGGRELDAAGPGLAALLPARAALHAQAVPLGAAEGTVEVAMSDPTALPLLDVLSAVMRRKVRPLLALEVRLGEALERVYGVELPPRLRRTRDRMARRARLAREG